MSHIKTNHNPIGSPERFLDLLLITLLVVVVMTLKGGTSGACAACKYQRRRCAADCPLAPYFPAEQPKLFQNVHRLFGVRSIVKILEKLDEAQKPEAMKSIIFQSFVRDRSPVHGCLGITQQLQYMIWLAEEELKVVNSQLQLYRSQQNNNNNNNNDQMIHEIVEKKEDVTSQLDLGMGLNVNNNNNQPFFSPLQMPIPVCEQPQMSYTYSCSEVNNNGFSPPPPYTSDSAFSPPYTADSGKEILTSNWSQQFPPPYHNNNNGFGDQNENCDEEIKSNNNGVMALQSQLVNLQMVSNNQQEEDNAHEYDEIHQFLEIIDERQSYADSKEVYASSSGELLKEPSMDQIGENELRSAATCFSLTSVN